MSYFSAVTCSPTYTSSMITYGSVSCTNSNTYKSQCTFSCDTGYRLNGQSVLTCNSDGSDSDGTGSWSDTTQPTCIGKYLQHHLIIFLISLLYSRA